MSTVPDKQRSLVRLRARHRCERCGVPAPNGHFHHRRSRRVRDEHTHHPCNGVWLCGTCHVHVHSFPTDARADGWIVSAFTTEPSEVKVTTTWGIRTHHCDGTFTF